MLSLVFTVALAAGSAMAAPVADGTISTSFAATCNQYTAERTCALGGDRVLTCLNYDPICPVDFPRSPSNATNTATNQASCEGLAEGAACTTVWSCCN